MEIRTIDRKSMKLLLTSIKEASEHTEIKIDCGGGDAAVAMMFVSDIKKLTLESKISLHIMRAESAAAYIVLSLDCYRTAEKDSVMTLHGGRIEGELNELFLSGTLKAMSKFFRETCGMVKKLATPERRDIFFASNILTLTREEIEKAGIRFI